MGQYHFHKHSFDDLFGLALVHIGIIIKKTLNKMKGQSRFYERLSKRYRYPKNIAWTIKDVAGVKTEIIEYKHQTSDHCLLQLHGGAYVYEFNDNYRNMAKQYLKIHPRFRIYSPYYALAPDHPFPKGLHQMLDVYKTLLESYEPEKIIITGDSAGGGLALALAYEIVDQGLPLPQAMITMSAWTDFLETGSSYQENKSKDIFFKLRDLDEEKKAYAGDMPYDHEKISPKYGDYNKLPNLLMFVGGNELIKSDSIDIAKQHPNAIVHEFSKMFHVFPLGFSSMTASRTSWAIIEDYLNQQLDEERHDDTKNETRLV